MSDNRANLGALAAASLVLVVGASSVQAAEPAPSADFKASAPPPSLRDKKGDVDPFALLKDARGRYNQRHAELEKPNVAEALRAESGADSVTVSPPRAGSASSKGLGVKPYNDAILKIAQGIVSAFDAVELNLGPYSEGTKLDMMNRLQDPGSRTDYNSRLSQAYKAVQETKKPHVFSTISGDPNETYQIAVRLNPTGDALMLVRGKQGKGYSKEAAFQISPDGRAQPIGLGRVDLSTFGISSAYSQISLDPTPVSDEGPSRSVSSRSLSF